MRGGDARRPFTQIQDTVSPGRRLARGDRLADKFCLYRALSTGEEARVAERPPASRLARGRRTACSRQQARTSLQTIESKPKWEPERLASARAQLYASVNPSPR